MIRTALQNRKLIALALAAMLAGGCSPSGTWDDVGTTYTRAEIERVAGPTGVVIGGIAASPAVSPEWKDAGTTLAKSIHERLSQRSDLTARINESTANEVSRALNGSASAQTSALRAIHERNSNLRYVIIGEITEFRHASTGSQSTQSQAIVAFTMNIVDLHQRRAIVTQRIDGRAWADKSFTADAYRKTPVTSYGFADTPLGLALRDVASQATDRFIQLTPVRVEEPIRIVDRLSDRRVRISSDAHTKVAAGTELFICIYDESGTRLKPVNDRTTSQPLKARIESRGVLPSAWIMGEPPGDVRLNRAVLVRTLPR